MNKKLISLAVASVFAGYGAVASAATVSGFTDMYYTLTDDSHTPATVGNTATDGRTCNAAGAQACLNSTEGKFTTNAEIDVSATPAEGVTVRIDTDMALTGAQSVKVEQAFFAWDLSPVTVMAGVFNNPIGQEAEDVIDWNFVQSSMIRKTLDNQTQRGGNNIEGVGVMGDAGPVTLTGAVLNHLGGANEENSLALLANMSPIPGLDLELGMLTQESETTGDTTPDNLGDLINFNVQFAPAGVAGLTVGLDYMTYDQIADTAYNIWGKFAIPGTDFSVGARIEELSWATPAGGGAAPIDVERTTFNVGYQATPNLFIALEMVDGDGVSCDAPATICANTGNFADEVGATGVNQGNLTQVELIATF